MRPQAMFRIRWLFQWERLVVTCREIANGHPLSPLSPSGETACLSSRVGPCCRICSASAGTALANASKSAVQNSLGAESGWSRPFERFGSALPCSFEGFQATFGDHGP